MRILIVKSLFVPNKNYYLQTFESVLNLIDFININNNNNIIIDILLIGWVNKKKFEDEFIKLQKHYNLICNKINEIKLELWSLNYGKYKILNFIKSYSKDKSYNVIFYFDHDILFNTIEPNNNFINESINLMKNKLYNKSIGILFYNQEEDARHQYTIFYKKSKLNNYTIVTPHKDDNGSIASGGFIINPNFIKIIDKFDLNYIYGLDEYFIIEKLKKNNYSYGVIIDLSIIHPYNDNKRYNRWKIEQIYNVILKKRIKYFLLIQQSHNFWNM